MNAMKAQDKMPRIPSSRTDPRARHRSGLAIILTIIFISIIVIVFLAIAIEYSRLLEMKERAQTASEASSLASVQGLAESVSAARQAGTSTAAQNPGNNQPVAVTVTADNRGDLILGRWHADRNEFEPTLIAPSAATTLVRFHADHPNGAVELFFSGFLGEPVELSAVSTAERRPDQPVPEQLRIQKSNGSGVLEVNGGTLIMNGSCIIESDNPSSLRVTNGGLLQTTQIELAGDLEVDSDESIMGYLSHPEQLPPRMPFTAPELEGLMDQTSPVSDVDEIISLKPGLYPYGLIATRGTYQLKGGIFFFGDQGLVLSGTAKIITKDCIIVLDKNASFTLDGTEAKLGKPTGMNPEIADLESFSIISRQATTDCTIRLLNGASMTCSGRIMCPMADVALKNSELRAPGMHVRTVDIEQGATITLGDGTPHPHTVRIVQ